jgi:hypothetical protein
MTGRSLVVSITVTFVGLLFGLGLHVVTIYFRDHGPSFGGFSLNGNGAIILLVLAPIALIIGEVYAVRNRAWLGVILLPVAIFFGVFVILGGV